MTPDPVFANIGKLLLANQIYEMHRIAHYVSGGLIVTLPGPDEDHNPETAAQLADVLRANPAVPYDKRIEAARLIEDLTASYQGGWYSVISLHGGGSPEAMKQEIWRNYPVGNKVELVERLLERNVLADPGRKIAAVRQPGKCCDAGCTPPSPTTMVALPGQDAERHRHERPPERELRRIPSPLPRRSRRLLGRAGRGSSTGSGRSTPSATRAGRRSRAGSSAARPISATTPSTATSRRAPRSRR